MCLFFSRSAEEEDRRKESKSRTCDEITTRISVARHSHGNCPARKFVLKKKLPGTKPQPTSSRKIYGKVRIHLTSIVSLSLSLSLSRARVVYFTNTRWMHFNLNARRILLLPSLLLSLSFFFLFIFIATGTSLHERNRQDADDREASSRDDWKVNVGHGVSSAFPLKFMSSVQQEFNLNVSIFF